MKTPSSINDIEMFAGWVLYGMLLRPRMLFALELRDYRKVKSNAHCKLFFANPKLLRFSKVSRETELDGILQVATCQSVDGGNHYKFETGAGGHIDLIASEHESVFW
jgi:hypothetical protein